MTTQVDFVDAGDLKVFVDAEQLKSLERKMAETGGFLDGAHMANAFNMLRPDELIWSFFVNNYLKGKEPMPFDLLVWNADSTRMPAANHRFYLRHCYLKNDLAKGKLRSTAAASTSSSVTIPIYELATREDHIAPARSVFAGAKLFGGDGALRARRLRPYRRRRQSAGQAEIPALDRRRDARRASRTGLPRPRRRRAPGGPTGSPGSPPRRPSGSRRASRAEASSPRSPTRPASMCGCALNALSPRLSPSGGAGAYKRRSLELQLMTKAPRSPAAPRLDLPLRMRRNRKAEWTRRLVAENVVTADDLIWPLFLVAGAKKRVPVAAMPGVERLSVDEAVRAAERAVKLEIPAIAFFPYTEAKLKDEQGSEAFNENNLVCQSLPRDQEGIPALGLVTDVALDPYTSHGHDGLMAGETILNDETVAALARQALNQARAGADIIAPSDMMDGRVGAIRAALDAEGFIDVQIMAYAAKYASAFYGPFREAVGSAARSRATSAPIRWTRPIPTRRCARSSSISPRAPTW